jgi:alkylhydroperoxidase/carboxymuconolactone decarboxylase family protein YurZ
VKQTDHEKKKKGKELLEELKIKRGGKVLDFHKRIANDPDLFTAFTQQYDLCYKNMTHLPPKYKELILVAIGCCRNAQKTIEVHSKLALENGATIEELGETLRLVFFLAGEASLLLGAEVFEPLEMQ